MNSKNYLITGAAKGIGREITLQLCKEGHCVWALSRDVDALAALVEKGARPITWDLGQWVNQPSAYTWPDDFPDTLDGLVNNAGILINAPVSELTAGDAELMWKINVQAPTLLVKHLLSRFAPGSHIVNIGSMGGFQGSAKFPGLSMYSATKAALASLSECWAAELAEHQISVNCLALGAVNTEMLQKAFPGYTAPVQPSEMGRYIAEFLQTGHRVFNGKILPVALTNPD